MGAGVEFKQTQKLRRITANELAIGTVLPRDASDITGRVLARRGEIIASRAQINTLIEHGLFVDEAVSPEPAALRRSSAVALVLEARRSSS